MPPTRVPRHSVHDREGVVPVTVTALCPNDNRTASARVDITVSHVIIEIDPIFFDFDRYEIRPGDAKTLEADAAWLRTNDVRILIEGQCDERGTDEYNIALGDRRARATMNGLVAQGIAADRMSTVSYGKDRPVCTEHTEACWALNRRAHIVVKPRGGKETGR